MVKEKFDWLQKIWNEEYYQISRFSVIIFFIILIFEPAQLSHSFQSEVLWTDHTGFEKVLNFDYPAYRLSVSKRVWKLFISTVRGEEFFHEKFWKWLPIWVYSWQLFADRGKLEVLSFSNGMMYSLEQREVFISTE